MFWPRPIGAARGSPGAARRGPAPARALAWPDKRLRCAAAAWKSRWKQLRGLASFRASLLSRQNTLHGVTQVLAASAS